MEESKDCYVDVDVDVDIDADLDVDVDVNVDFDVDVDIDVGWSASPLIFLLKMIPFFLLRSPSPPWTKYFPSPNIFLLFLLRFLVNVHVKVNVNVNKIAKKGKL